MIQFSACKIWQVSYKVFEALSKTPPKIVHYKARPPHTAILDSLGPPARLPPTTHAIPESATDATPRPTSGLTSRLSGLTSRFSIETSRAIRNYPDLVLGTSERFRTVQRHLRTVPNGSEALSVGLRVVYEWFACRFRSARSLGSFL